MHVPNPPPPHLDRHAGMVLHDGALLEAGVGLGWVRGVWPAHRPHPGAHLGGVGGRWGDAGRHGGRRLHSEVSCEGWG